MGLNKRSRLGVLYPG